MSRPAARAQRLRRRVRRLAYVALVRRFPFLHRLLPTVAPLVAVPYPLGGARAGALGVLLPGIEDGPEEFDQHGFVSAARDHRLPWDLVAVDGHYGYFRAGTIVERLHEDVVLPAHAAGYRQVWLVGISLGGLGALRYASCHPGAVTGLVLFAPFLGFRDTIDAIAAAGGLRHWQPPQPPQGFAQELWHWLKGYLEPGAPRPPILLGYGDRDMFAQANALLAELLPPAQVVVAPGGHDWRTWRALWERMLASGLLRGPAAAQGGAGRA